MLQHALSLVPSSASRMGLLGAHCGASYKLVLALVGAILFSKVTQLAFTQA